MLKRKFAPVLENYLKNEPDKILLVNGARQIGKSFIIRYIGTQLFEHFVEINLKEDREGKRYFESVHDIDEFHVLLGTLYGNQLGTRGDTLVFLDEIQSYPHLLTMLKFLNQEKRYRYVASGSQLGVALAQTPSIPIGSVAIEQMYPLDFEEFLWSVGCGVEAIETMRGKFRDGESLNEAMHSYMMRMLRYYLIVGGMPDAVQRFVENQNVQAVRTIQRDIHTLYQLDASQYDEENKLKIRRIFDLIPSNLENKKKRVVFKDIDDKKGRRFADFFEEFDYLTASGVALQVSAISNPRFPIKESQSKNLLKLYLNDVGLLTNELYSLRIEAVLRDELGVNLGTVYESFVAQELHAHGYDLFYYDNKKNGEVDFLISDYNSLSILPIEVKSGKDYKVHSALDSFLSNKDYDVESAVVFSNSRLVATVDAVTYMPIYYVMFFSEYAGNDSLRLEIPAIPE